MAETDWKAPGSAVNVDYETGEAWANVNNVKTDDANNASVLLSKNDESDWLRCYTFGFDTDDIPQGAIITGIRFRVDRYVSATGPSDKSVRLRIESVDVGDDYASAASWATGQETVYYGGENDLWGINVVEDNFRTPSFGFAISVTSGSGEQTAYLNYIAAKIYYETGVKVTLDRARIRPNYVVENFNFQSGEKGNPTNRLLNHLKFDDNAASSLLTARVGNHATWRLRSDDSERNTNSSGDSVQEIGRGRNLDTQTGTGFAKIACGDDTSHEYPFAHNGALILKFRPQFTYNTGAYHYIFHIRHSTFYEIYFYYDYINDRFNLRVDLGSNTDIFTAAYTSNEQLQQPTVVHCAWSRSPVGALGKDFAWLGINGKGIGRYTAPGTPTNGGPTNFHIGCDYSRSSTYDADIIIDELQTFAGPVVPGGAYYVGPYGDAWPHSGGLLADIDNPHKDIIFYWDGQATAAKAGSGLQTDKAGTVTGSGQFSAAVEILGSYGYDTNGTGGPITFPIYSNDIFDPTGGSALFAFWVRGANGDNDAAFGLRVDADNEILFEYMADGEARFTVTADGETPATVSAEPSPSGAIFSGRYHWVKLTWTDLTVSGWTIGLEIDFVDYGKATGTGAFTGSPEKIYFGSDGAGGNSIDAAFGYAFITNSPTTPQIWTSLGIPLNEPELWIG